MPRPMSWRCIGGYDVSSERRCNGRSENSKEHPVRHDRDRRLHLQLSDRHLLAHLPLVSRLEAVAMDEISLAPGVGASASMAKRRLYFASRSDRVIEPTLIWFPDQP